MKGRELNRRLLQHRGIRDRVAAIDGFRLVTRHSHRRAARYAGTLQVAHRGPTKIVDQPAGDAGVSAGCTPSPAKVLDTAAIRLNKHPRDDCAPQKLCASSSSLVQEAVLMVKSVQDGVRHNSA